MKSCKDCNLHKFIVDELPKQYQLQSVNVGLISGQRQRIGTRALYHNPLLILDEATSALDNQTEK